MQSSWASLISVFVNFSSFRMQQPDFWLTCRNIRTYPTTCGVSFTGFQLLIVLISRSLRWFGRLYMTGTAPDYIAELCLPVGTQTGRRALRSASRNDLIIPSFRTTTCARRDFSIAAPRIWNALPPSVRAARGYMVFSKLLDAFFQLFDGHVLSASERLLSGAL
jgi:hypothetical protein